MKGNTKFNQKRIEAFTKKSASLRKAIASQFKATFNRAVAYRTSIAELGKSLTQLQELCKQYKRPFRQVVSHEKYGIQMPVRTAYRYISLVADMNHLSAKIVARIEAAGYDPASTRVATKVRQLGSKVNKLTATDLAAVLKKKRSSKKAHTASPEQRLQADLKAALSRYLDTLSDDTTHTQALEKAQEYLSDFRVRASGLMLVGKAA